MSKLDTSSVRTIMVHALRCPMVAQQMRMAGLSQEEFVASRFAEFSVLWEVLTEYYDNCTDGAAPTYLIIESAMANKFYNEEEGRRWVEKSQEFLRYAFKVPSKALNQNMILRPDGPLQNLIDELKIAPLLGEAAEEEDPDARNDLITKVAEVRAASRVSTGARISVFDEDAMRSATRAANFSPTGIDFIEAALGGLPPVCACGLLAGTGGGKTTFSVQYTTEQVFRQRNVLYLQYEEQVTNSSLLKRFMSCATKMTRKELEGDYDDYPEEIREKFRRLKPEFDQYCHLYSMAGDVPNQGMGGVPEIEAIIQREIQMGWKPDIVMIDWLEPLANNWANIMRFTKAKDLREIYKFVVGEVVKLRDKYSCQVFLLHQIAAGILEKMSPATKPDKNIAAELKSFPNLMNFCFCLGKKDEDSNCLWFSVPKARDAGNVHRVIRLDPQFNRFEDAAGMFKVNELAGMNNEAYFKATK